MKQKTKNMFQILKEKGLEAIKFSGVAFLISFFGAIAGSQGTSKNWRNLGEYTFTIKGKKYYCCKSDVLVFGILGIVGLKIIF